MKAAIITYYYGSNNYGGNLQSYALVKFIQNNCHINVKQLSYKKPRKHPYSLRDRLSKIYHRYFKDVSDMKGIERRNRLIAKFNLSIPHTNIIYSPKTIAKSVKDYDVFIAGSDQIWNPKWSDSVYKLDFVPSTKYKMAYAVSLGVSNLDMDNKEILRKSLSSYNAVSVREQEAVELLTPLSHHKVEWLLDPTLLLSVDEWDEICSPRKYDDKYVFTYFLGNSSVQRELARKFADRFGLKIVTIPYVCGYCNDCDKEFGDIKDFDASPADFISLIKNAQYVFTDSFHASVFSILYRKQFFIFHRAEDVGMGTRIRSLMDLFNMQDRFCDTSEKITLEYIESLKPIDYNLSFSKYEKKLIESKNFIIEHIKEARESIQMNK